MGDRFGGLVVFLVVAVVVMVMCVVVVVRVRMGMSIAISAMRMSMIVAVIVAMTMVVMSKCSHTNQIYEQPGCANQEQLPQSLCLSPFSDSLNGLKHDL